MPMGVITAAMIMLYLVEYGKLRSSNPRGHVAHLCTLVKIAKNWNMPPNIPESARPISNKFSQLVDIWAMTIKVTFVLQSPKKGCYGNQLISGVNSSH